ncbi:MAG: alpha/beta fold hydrolase [Myxococcales bacterium]|nr:alpha/beta fold hydrolase [Myxococcales bacterium]
MNFRRKRMARGSMMGFASTLAVFVLAIAAPGGARANGRVIKSHEHEAERAGIKIAIYEKWATGEETKWRNNGKVILLVHGATWSSRCTFDPVANFSLMDTLAEAGYDVFALDLHGYGKSGKSERDWTESPSAAEDIDAAVDYIRAFRWVEKVHVFGYQWGAQAAGIFGMKKPNKIGKLVLFGMRHTTIERSGEPAGPFRLNGASNAMMKPDDGDLDPEFVRRRSQVCLAADPQSPNGALRDLARASFVDPLKLRAPTLMIMGDKDMEPAVLEDRIGFFKNLVAKNKWFIVVPGLGKFAPVERGRAKFEASLLAFLDLP